ncbi:hypothetical protein BDZ85DRAFT_279423 [Elsinoe ampelina]|uniref:S-adenosyl-L-methionine-dependent methyltransferase n=1 Tax=Elsinoe ampelina TaxID=302913 RepID=A0A6A6GK39_9PEZI|nr:hypothetical protein BDZ85DRAFT_279423 [Elsinoe ampelina]
MANSSDDYPIPRGVIDSVRLNVGHLLWKKEFPWVVHPSVPLKGRENLRIADVGCGTGLWVLEAYEEFPHAEAVEGLDIALHQAPAKHLLPGNVKFSYFNAYEDVPEQFIGRYDLIHARFLLALVKNDDPIPLVQMLKPDGYIQWNETDWECDTYVGLEENGITKEESGMHRMRSFGRQGSSLGTITWPQKLANILQEQGMKLIKEDRTTLETFPRMYASYWTDTIVAAAIDAHSKMPAGQLKSTYARLIDGASEDARKGIAWVADHIVVVAQKNGQ